MGRRAPQFVAGIKSPASNPAPVAFLDNNTRLLVCEYWGDHFREYDLVSGREIASWAGPAGTSLGVAVTPQEQLVLTIGTGGNALYRNRLTGAIERFDLAIAGAEAPQFSPNGRYFSASSRLASPKIWETSTRREVAELTGSVQFVSVAFSPDGSRLAASGTGVDAIRIWDLASYQPLLTLPAQGSLLRPVQFSPDGNVVGAVSSGGTLHLWRAPSWEEIAAAEKARPAQSVVK